MKPNLFNRQSSCHIVKAIRVLFAIEDLHKFQVYFNISKFDYYSSQTHQFTLFISEMNFFLNQCLVLKKSLEAYVYSGFITTEKVQKDQSNFK